MIFEFKSKGRIQDTTTSSSISERRNMLLVYDSEKRIFNVFFVVERSGTSKTHLQATFTPENIVPLTKSDPPNGANYAIAFHLNGKRQEIHLMNIPLDKKKELHQLIFDLVGKAPAGSIRTLPTSMGLPPEPKKFRANLDNVNQSHAHAPLPDVSSMDCSSPRAFMSSVSLNNSAVHRGSSLISPQSARSSAMFGKSFKQISTLYDCTPSSSKAVGRPESTTPSTSERRVERLPPDERRIINSDRGVYRQLHLDDKETNLSDLRRISPKISNSSSSGVLSLSGVSVGGSPLGLPNIGNSCYMNSVLQCIFNLELFTKFRQHLKNWFQANRGVESEKYKEMAPIIYAIYNIYRATEKRQYMQKFRDAVTSLGKFGGYNEEDAHEFLMFLLERIENESRALNATNVAPIPDFVAENFVYRQTRTFHCQHCDWETSMNDSSNHFILQMRADKERQSLFELFTELENADRDGDYKCERCGTNLIRVNFSYTKMPFYLIFMIQRYAYDEGGRSKICAPIIVDRTLNFARKARRAATAGSSSSISTRLRSRQVMTADPDFDSPTKFESLGYKDVFDSTVDEDDDKENKSDDDDEIIVDKSMQSPRKNFRYTPLDYSTRRVLCERLGILDAFVANRLRNVYEQCALVNQVVYFASDDAPARVGNVSADGNCMFRALSYVITGGNESAHLTIRKKICAFMEQYADTFARHCGKSDDMFSEYLREMREAGMWGSDVELLAFATMIGMSISTFYNNKWFFYHPRFSADSAGQLRRLSACNQYENVSTIYLVNSAEHYQPVISIPELDSYLIKAITHHIGSSTDKGHYVATLRRNNNDWLRLNDSLVEEIQEQEAFSSASETGYIFFYELVTQ